MVCSCAWTILLRDKVDIFRDDKIWDIPQNVRKYIKQTIVSDFNEDQDSFSFEKTQNFDNITSVLEKQVEMIDGSNQRTNEK